MERVAPLDLELAQNNTGLTRQHRVQGRAATTRRRDAARPGRRGWEGLRGPPTPTVDPWGHRDRPF